MNDKFKKYLFIFISFITGILVTLGSVIFQNYSYEKQIFIFEIIVVILIIPVIIVFLYVIYFKIKNIKWKIFEWYKERLGMDGRIKKEINQLKKGERGTYIYSSDVDEILSNRKKYENMKDFDILWNKLLEYNKKMTNLSYFPISPPSTS